MATYEETAYKIIKDAIKSAIFIDENAKEPYSEDNTQEAERSIALYNQFKDNGISLSVYKYSNTNYLTQKEYIFANRDLVLLDWKLEGDGHGGEKSLELLDEIVNRQKHIHFCVIYTSEKKDSVLRNILTYFSGSTKAEYDEIKIDLADKEEDIKKILPILNELSLKRFTDYKILCREIYRSNRELLTFICEKIVCDSSLCSLIKCGMAFDDDSIKSNVQEPCPSSIDSVLYTLCIENTIITILNKEEVIPDILFQKFGETISAYRWGVMQLAGLEMQNIQKKNSSFINSEILRVTKKALGYHKNEGVDNFEDFLRNVMLEQQSLNLRDEKLTLVESIDSEEYDDRLKDEYISMNVFYNSVYLKKNKPLSFGDVFRCDGEFYICITALCDCARPEKRNNYFYFAKGTSITYNDALKIGDEGFVSYLSKNEYVRWNLKGSSDNPVYIVPVSLLVPCNLIKEQKIEVKKLVFENETSEIKSYVFEYVTTIKQNYTQRIANHAFSHPVRVGIDFVKKK